MLESAEYINSSPGASSANFSAGADDVSEEFLREVAAVEGVEATAEVTSWCSQSLKDEHRKKL